MNLKKRLLLLLIIATTILLYFYLKFVNNNNYSPVPGPSYVNGWNQNTSKNVRDYIKESSEPLIVPKNFCSQKKLLLVIVIVRPDNFEARSAIRETWGQKNDDISFYFLVGEDKNHHYLTKLKLKKESAQYNDIVLENFIDSYNNLTLKSINMLKLFNRHCSKSYKYLLKIDDDVFLIVPNLLKMLRSRQIQTDVLLGKLIVDTKPYRDPSNKWYVPYEFYPDENYPDYLCGPGYLMSSDVAQKLYRCALETPIFFLEDVYITGICANKIKVKPRHNPMFTCNELSKYVCLFRDVCTLHYYTPEEIRKSYRMLTENKCPPEGSLMEFIFSFF